MQGRVSNRAEHQKMKRVTCQRVQRATYEDIHGACVYMCVSGDFTFPPHNSNTGKRSEPFFSFCDSAYRSTLRSYCSNNSLLSSLKSALITLENVHSERKNSSKYEHSDIRLSLFCGTQHETFRRILSLLFFDTRKISLDRCSKAL